MTYSKIVFLTGCNGQLGTSISKTFSEANWKVCGMDLSEKTTNHYLSFYQSFSVLSRTSFSSFFLDAINHLKLEGASQLCLINNAGVAVFTPSEERTLEEFDFVARVNLLGPIFGITEFKKFVSDSPESCCFHDAFKSIINIASIYGIQSPNPSIYTDTARNSSEIYGATKAGLIQMTKYFAVHYADIPIIVNCIAPGGILNEGVQGSEFIQNYSNLVPMKRLCYETELAKTCLFVADSGVEYLSGQTISLDGGMSSW